MAAVLLRHEEGGAILGVVMTDFPAVPLCAPGFRGVCRVCSQEGSLHESAKGESALVLPFRVEPGIKREHMTVRQLQTLCT